MDVAAMATNVTPDNSSTSINAMKKAMDVEQNTTLKVLENTMQQQLQLQQQQQVAAKTGVGVNLNITA